MSDTLCNPRFVEGGCLLDPAFGKTVDFNFLTKFITQDAEFYQYPEVNWSDRGLAMTISNAKDVPFIHLTNYIFFGRTDVTLQAVPGPGVMTSIILLSDVLDAIGFVLLSTPDGGTFIQTLILRMNVSSFEYMFYPFPNATTSQHKYSIEWTPTAITFSVNDVVGRQVTRANLTDAYPQTPMQLRVFSRVTPLVNTTSTITRSEANATANFTGGPYLGYLQRLQVRDDMDGKPNALAYNYTDRSGASQGVSVITKSVSSTSSLTSTTPPASPTRSQPSGVTPSVEVSPPNQVNTGAIAGGVIGGVVIILLAGLALLLYRRKKSARARGAGTEETVTTEETK